MIGPRDAMMIEALGSTIRELIETLAAKGVLSDADVQYLYDGYKEAIASW